MLLILSLWPFWECLLLLHSNFYVSFHIRGNITLYWEREERSRIKLTSKIKKKIEAENMQIKKITQGNMNMKQVKLKHTIF